MCERAQGEGLAGGSVCSPVLRAGALSGSAVTCPTSVIVIKPQSLILLFPWKWSDLVIKT